MDTTYFIKSKTKIVRPMLVGSFQNMLECLFWYKLDHVMIEETNWNGKTDITEYALDVFMNSQNIVDPRQ